MKTGTQARHGKYFSHILISYLIFVIISTASSGMIYHVSSRRLVEQQTEADYVSFEQFYNLIDQELSNAVNKVSELQKDGDMLPMLEEEFSGGISTYSVYSVKKKLRISANNSFSDLFIYFPNSDKVVSGYNAPLSGKRYFGTYYTSEIYRDGIFDVDSSYRLLKITTRTNENTLAIKLRMVTNSRYNLLSAVCVLNPTYINQRIDYLEKATGGSVMILDSSDQMLLCSFSDAIDVSALPLDESKKEITIDGKQYILFTEASSVASCKYVFLIPVDSMYQSLSAFNLYSIINLITFSLFGILLAVILTKRNYKPVMHLVEYAHLLNDKSLAADNCGEEFKYIEETLQTASSEKRIYLNQTKKFNLIFSLINGIMSTGSPVKKSFAEIEKELISERFAVMVFDIEEWNDDFFSLDHIEERPLLSRIILPNVIEELCDEKNRGYVISVNTDHFVCVVNLADETDAAALTSIAERSLSFLNDKMGILCTVGIGNPYCSLKEMRSSYNEARRAAEYKIIFGTGKVLCYRNLYTLSGSYNSVLSSSVPIMLNQCIKNDSVDCGEVFDDIFTNCFNGAQPCTPEIARSFILNLCMQCNELLNTLDIQSDSIPSEHQFDLNIETYKAIDDFREYFIRHMNDIRKEYHEHHAVKGLGQSIREFIERHYADLNLGVNEIGIRFNLSATYCSKIFKQETNQSILECINSVRIEKACALLVDTADPLDKIAQDCGYNSSAVFISNFKKICGTTPGNYRKIMRK